MKRLITLLCAGCLLLGSQGPAGAIEIKASGTWEVGMGWADNQRFSDADQGDYNDSFYAAQRIRPQFDFIADETLRAVLAFEIGTTVWGENSDDSPGGALDADGNAVKVRRAYLQWTPMGNLDLRIGIQGVALPSATFGNPVFDADVAGVVANYTFTDDLSLTAFWLRPFDGGWNDGEKNRLDEMDIFGFSLPITGQGFSVTPWAMYARNGNQSDYWTYRWENTGIGDVPGAVDQFKGSSNLWWAGAAFELDMLNPFSFKLDAMYGAAKGGDAPEYSGYLISALFEYKSEAAWGNPGLIGWYASGDDGDDYKDGKFGRMPIVGADNAGFAPANYGFPGDIGCMADSILTSSGVGTWALGLQLDEFSFVDTLSHTVRAVYVRGTNDEEMIRNNPNVDTSRGSLGFGYPYNNMGDHIYLTKQDSAWEFDFLSTWAVNEYLNVYLETAYVKLDLDSDVWGKRSDTTDAWKAMLLLEYSF